MSAYSALITNTSQLIKPGTWVVLRFDEVSDDDLGWHASSDMTDPRSALIIPTLTGRAWVSAMIHWRSASALKVAPKQYISQVARDPYAVKPNTTATGDRAPTPGAQFERLAWNFTVRKGQPLAIRVQHDGSGPLAVYHAQFKVWVP